MDVRITSFLMQARTNAASIQERAQNALIDKIAQTNPQQANVLREKASEQKNLLQQLQSSGSSAQAERKEQARQKVERLKAQIAALRMMSGGDPKMVARRAAQLARELQSAAREYSGKGGGDVMSTLSAGASASASMSAGAVAPTSEVATEAVSADAVAVAPVAAEGAEGAAVGGDTQVQGAISQAKSTEAEAKAEGAEGEDADSGDGVSEREKTGTAIRDEIAKIISEGNKAVGEKKADEDFKSEVRSLMAQLKIILKGAKDRMKGEGNSDIDVQQAERALQDTEKELNDIGRSDGGSVNILI